jgi:hypothetical protein
MNKIYVIDEGYLKHRAIFSFRHNPQLPATYTFMRMCISSLKKTGATIEDRVIMACDFGRSWRKIEDPNYKAQRKEAREKYEDREWWTTIYEEFNNFYKRIESSINWNFCRLLNTEADDWASVVSRFYKDNEVTLISADKDWEMLASFPNVKIYSPLSKKFKEIKYPEKVLMEKIQGDISDNLLEKPKNELEFEKRKKIVNLLELPGYIEQPMREILINLPMKSLFVNKLPYRSIQVEMKKLYRMGD